MQDGGALPNWPESVINAWEHLRTETSAYVGDSANRFSVNYESSQRVKIYDNEWFIKHGLSIEEAADLLVAWNITFVIAQSKYLPMYDSAVQSAVRFSDASRYAMLDDVSFRKALCSRDIGYFACLNIGFDPRFSSERPSILPIDQHGHKMRQQDCYLGIPPDRTGNLTHKTQLLENAVSALQPDVVYLGSIRWPGFWETWLPGDNCEEKPDYCYSSETLSRFAKATGIDLPIDDPTRAGAMIANSYRPAWSAWKCAVTVEAIRLIRASVDPLRSGLQISINTLPFVRSDFECAVEDVFGEDISKHVFSEVAMRTFLFSILTIIALVAVQATPASAWAPVTGALGMVTLEAVDVGFRADSTFLSPAIFAPPDFYFHDLPVRSWPISAGRIALNTQLAVAGAASFGGKELLGGAKR
jgi:hypothetical protein